MQLRRRLARYLSLTHISPSQHLTIKPCRTLYYAFDMSPFLAMFLDLLVLERVTITMQKNLLVRFGVPSGASVACFSMKEQHLLFA